MSTATLDQLAQRAGQLYSLPAVAVQVLRFTGSSEVDTRALKACLENDPALTTRLLRVVNSSLFGVSRKVTDLGQSIGLLGIKPLKMLVLGFSLPRQLLEGVEKEVLARYWRHSLLKATASRELAQRIFSVPGDEAFIAGLLQDIGVLALVQQLGAPFLCFLAQAESAQRPLRELEQETLGFDHVELSARLLATWGLPQPLIAAVQMPVDAPELMERPPFERALPQSLHLAELLALLLESREIPVLAELLALGHKYCKLTLDEVQTVVAALEPQVMELGQILSLDLPAGESYLDVLAAAHGQLAETSAASILETPQKPGEEDLLREATALRSEVDVVLKRPVVAAVAQHVNVRGSCSLAASRQGAPSPPREHVDLDDNQPLMTRVGEAIARCRGLRQSLTLVLIHADGELDETRRLALLADLRVWSQQRGLGWFVRGNCLAFVWEDCRREDGRRLAQHMLDRAAAGGTTLSAGLATVALPPPNFPPADLITAAERCLSGAMFSGGNAVKSIEF